MNTKGNIDGWLWKWTNYINGYQKRWFVLLDGHLSYYKSKSEIGQVDCRGSINLFGTHISSDKESCSILISNAGSLQTYFHLKADSEDDRLRWVAAMKHAKSSIFEPNDSHDKDHLSIPDLNLNVKLNSLVACNDLVLKHASEIQSALCEVQMAKNIYSTDPNTLSEVLKRINEAAVVFRTTTCQMINCSSEFTQTSNKHAYNLQNGELRERKSDSQIQEQLENMKKRNADLEKMLKMLYSDLVSLKMIVI